MARKFSDTQSSTLQKIADKQMMEDAPRMISIDQLVVHEDNEYIFGMQDIEHMEQGIRQNGFKGAIEVWDLENGMFLIYSGHRRFEASVNLGYEKIRCFVYALPESETERRRTFLGSNLYGRNSVNSEDPIHTARQIAYHRQTLKLEGFSGDYRAEIAREFGISESQIYKYESLLKLTDEVQEAVANKEIPFAQASSMAVLGEEEQLAVKSEIETLKIEKGSDSITRDDVQDIIDQKKKKKTNTDQDKKSTEPVHGEHPETENQMPGQLDLEKYDKVTNQEKVNTKLMANEDAPEEDSLEEDSLEEDSQKISSEEKARLDKVYEAIKTLENILSLKDTYEYNEQIRQQLALKLDELQKVIIHEKVRLVCIEIE